MLSRNPRNAGARTGSHRLCETNRGRSSIRTHPISSISCDVAIGSFDTARYTSISEGHRIRRARMPSSYSRTSEGFPSPMHEGCQSSSSNLRVSRTRSAFTIKIATIYSLRLEPLGGVFGENNQYATPITSTISKRSTIGRRRRANQVQFCIVAMRIATRPPNTTPETT